MQKRTTVTLREQVLKDGRISLILETYKDGARKRESLGLYIQPGKTRAIKESNAAARFKAEAILHEARKKAERMDLGIEESYDGYDIRFFDYYRKCMNSKGPATKATWKSALNYLMAYEKREDITFRSITRQWVLGFREFMENTDTFRRRGNKPGPSVNTRILMFAKLTACLKQAVEVDMIIPKNPAMGIPMFHQEETIREYLTAEDLKKLTKTKCGTKEKRNMCLFACLTGLRWSDVSNLKWCDVTEEDGRIKITKRLQKKQNMMYQIINKEAASLLPERRNPEDKVFIGVPELQTMNWFLRRWCKMAGIDKHISFHCLRHTFGTLLVNNGVDLYTASKLLGHSNIKATQIYAKIIDESKVKAVDSLPKLFKN